MELSDDLVNCQIKRSSNINAYEVNSRNNFNEHTVNIEPESEPEPSKKSKKIKWRLDLFFANSLNIYRIRT